MLDLQIKLDRLFNDLDKCSLFSSMDNCYKKIINNKELKSKIDLYHKNNDSSLYYDIYEYDEIKEYKKYETELNLMIMKINSKLNRIIKDGDINESN